ncbi:dTDP-4-dehydrorhamnose 3,5-epimerase, partial [Pelagibacteraceae bacterium]|nr:dTDP-4-dehydrorhamnose 3,5-epimerase [Pelagibacteraceae bacterium]
MIYKVKKFINKPFIDHRGYYWTSWQSKSIKNIKFKHDKFSLSKKNVLRGLHGDDKTWKLVSCPYGEFLLVVVNCVKKSKDYLKFKSWVLSHKNGL